MPAHDLAHEHTADPAAHPTNGRAKTVYEVCVLDQASAGEILTLQRAAYITEAAAHRDFALPALTQSIDELRAEMASPDVIALGVREAGRLLGAVRLRRTEHATEVGRLTVVPDRQGQGIGSLLLSQAETAFAETEQMRLFTGEHSLANIRLYERNGYVETARTPAGEYSLVHFAKRKSGRDGS